MDCHVPAIRANRPMQSTNSSVWSAGQLRLWMIRWFAADGPATRSAARIAAMADVSCAVP